MMALALLSMEWPAMMALGVSFFQWNGLEVRRAFLSTGMAWGCWLGVSFSQWNGLELRWAFPSMEWPGIAGRFFLSMEWPGIALGVSFNGSFKAFKGL